MNELVSIGLPVYNGGKFLKNILDNLINQTYKNIEIIISNNCSTDDTDIICKSYKYDKRVKYYKQNKIIPMLSNFYFVLDKSL